MPSNNYGVIHEDGDFKIARRKSRGRSKPGGYSIYIGENHRPLKVTVDELFQLTEALDRLCDHIEDSGGAVN